jgi:hypothetical protein
LDITSYIMEAYAKDELATYLKCYSFICQRKYENICDILFHKTELICNDALTRKNSDLLWMTRCSKDIFKNHMISKNRGNFNVTLLFRGNLTESRFPQMFQNLSNLLGCVEERFNYNVVSASSQKR